MKVIIAGKPYNYDKAARLLRNNGWNDDIKAYLGAMDMVGRFCSLSYYKRDFREWKRNNVKT